MEELQVPEFVNERYYEKKYHESKKVIKNLKIHNKLIKLIGLGAVLVLAGTNPKVQNAFDVAIKTIVEYDNAKFDADKENEIREIEELNDRSVEEIMESGRTMR